MLIIGGGNFIGFDGEADGVIAFALGDGGKDEGILDLAHRGEGDNFRAFDIAWAVEGDGGFDFAWEMILDGEEDADAFVDQAVGGGDDGLEFEIGEIIFAADADGEDGDIALGESGGWGDGGGAEIAIAVGEENHGAEIAVLFEEAIEWGIEIGADLGFEIRVWGIFGRFCEGFDTDFVLFFEGEEGLGIELGFDPGSARDHLFFGGDDVFGFHAS